MRVIDNFLNDADWHEFNDLSLWDSKINNTFVHVNDLGDSIIETIVSKIWDTFSLDHREEISYYEYWTNFLNKDEPLDWHTDKDETMYEKRQKIEKPFYGAVLYPEHHISGGFLEIEHSKGQLERLAAEPNRLVLFPAGEKYHRVSPIHYGQRLTFATNLWK